MRVGHGYDVHRLVKGRRFLLGGVVIDYPLGPDGHSDADVLCHAVIDAILGACSLGDIGVLFPDTDMAYKNADSLDLLRKAMVEVRKKGYKVINIDATIICQQPKLRKYIFGMRANIAASCRTAIDDVNVKATTEEGLGFTGDGSGVAVHAVCLVEKADPDDIVMKDF